MIFKIVLLSALVVSSALCSAIKGRLEEPTKGGSRLLAPIEQQRLIEQHQIKGVQRVEQQQAPLAEQKLEEVHQQKEELKQEELKQEVVAAPAPAKGLRYEARPQIPRLEERPSYEQQREELHKTEQHREEVSKTNRFNEQRQEERFEQQQRDYDLQQQIELNEEQRRYEEPTPIQAVIEETREQITQQQLSSGIKGAEQRPSPPLAEAEPYAFSYQVEGSTRTESGDTKGVVRGQYTLQGADGSSRVVDYVADHNGFRASVNTNEFGTEAKSPAGVALRSSQPLAEDITLRLEGKTREDLLPPAPSKTAPPPAVPAKPDNWQVAATKTQQAPLSIPQAPIALAEDLPTKSAPLPAKKLEERPLSPAKGQKLIQQEQDLRQELIQEPIKSAEHARAPKAIGEDLKQLRAEPRSNFESATAHRAYRSHVSYVAAPPPAIVRPVAPPAVVVRTHPAPVVRGPVPAVSRTYLQRERYPPSPVQSGYRRGVSFYSAPSTAGFDDEQPNFEQPDQ